jgi:hypothetical protein
MTTPVIEPVRTELHEAGGIAARLRQTIDKAGADWIGDDDAHESNGWLDG